MISWRSVAAAAGPSRALLQPAAPRRLGAAVCSSRGFAKKVKQTDEAALGWTRLIAPLEPEGVNFSLPSLKSLLVTHPTQGAGMAGARKFKAVMPQLRWHNPQASIEQRWNRDGSPPQMTLTLTDETELVEDVLGLRVEEVLGLAMRKAGADEVQIRDAVAWAIKHMEGRLPTPKPHEWRRAVKESPDESSADAALADGLGVAYGGADAAGGWDGAAEVKS